MMPAACINYSMVQGVSFACWLLRGISRHCRALGQKLLPEAWQVAIRVQEVFGSQAPKFVALTISILAKGST